MNRKDRRQLQRQGIDHRTLRAIEDETKRLTVSHTTNCCAASALLVLRDQFGFGTKRAQRFMSSFAEMFEDISQGRIALTDVMATIEDELDITFDSE